MSRLRRGMVIDGNLDPTKGSETGNIRPCVIVTNNAYGEERAFPDPKGRRDARCQGDCDAREIRSFTGARLHSDTHHYQTWRRMAPRSISKHEGQAYGP
jgi:hypothetical protein